jgi:hypothetical protein
MVEKHRQGQATRLDKYLRHTGNWEFELPKRMFYGNFPNSCDTDEDFRGRISDRSAGRRRQCRPIIEPPQQDMRVE